MSSPQIERKLAAIMFTDIAGYTKIMTTRALLILLSLFIISCKNSTSTVIDNSGLIGVWEKDRAETIRSGLCIGEDSPWFEIIKTTIEPNESSPCYGIDVSEGSVAFIDTFIFYFDEGLGDGTWDTYGSLILNADSTYSSSGISQFLYQVKSTMHGTWSTGECDSESDVNDFACIEGESFDNYLTINPREGSYQFVPGLSEQEIYSFIQGYGEPNDFEPPSILNYTYLMINENQLALKLTGSGSTTFYDRR